MCVCIYKNSSVKLKYSQWIMKTIEAQEIFNEKLLIMLSQLNNVSFPMKVRAKRINLNVSSKLLVITYFHSSRTCYLLGYSSGL